jgi:hypothetical protein
MEEELRCLFLRYGIVKIKACIEQECIRLYEGLQKFYEPKIQNIEKHTEKSKSFMNINEVKNNETESLKRKTEEVMKANLEEGLESNLGNDLEILSEPKIEKPQESAGKVKKGVLSKEEQAEAVEKKRKELEAQDINPGALLTEENLRKWLSEGKTYQKISRDYVGVHESEVSAKARSFGLRSNVSKYKFYRRR